MLSLPSWWPWKNQAEAESPSVRLAAQFLPRLEQWKQLDFPPARGGTIAVLLTAWGRTGVPFFSAELALALRRAGHAVEILGDWTDLGDNASDPKEIEIVEDLYARLVRLLPARRLEGGEFSLPEEALAEIASQAFENVVRKERSEAGARAVMARQKADVDFLIRQAGRIASHLRTRRYATLILPGGLWSLSGLYAVAAKATGTPFWTFDSGRGSLAFGRDGAAAHFPDFAEAYRESAVCVDRETHLAEWVEREAGRLLDIRRRGKDAFELQPRESCPAEECDVLVPLNYRVDTAAMSRQRAFADVTSWLDAVVAWAVGHPGIRLSIRQHPCERLKDFRSLEDYSRIAAAAPDRIRFYSCEDPVNTYDLIEKSRVTLPYTSRTGIEAALLGKPVVVGTRSYYGACPFVSEAATPAEYFQKVEAALAGRVNLPPRRSAALAYYLAEVCALEKTIFTPIPDDLREWCQPPPGEFWARSEQERLVATLAGRGNFFLNRFLQSLPEELAR